MDRRVEVIKKKKISNSEQRKDKVKNQFEEKVQDPEEDLKQSSGSLDENTLLQIQIGDLNDKLLRAQAEIQNVRRVAGQEVTKARLFGVESLAREFISVGDNLQRALDSCTAETEIKMIREGLELTLKSFEESLKTAGISPLNPIGEIFNPEKHEAISVVEDDKRKPNTVVEVVQIGFTIQERMLRPAKVVVSKKKEK